MNRTISFLVMSIAFSWTSCKKDSSQVKDTRPSPNDAFSDADKAKALWIFTRDKCAQFVAPFEADTATSQDVHADNGKRYYIHLDQGYLAYQGYDSLGSPTPFTTKDSIDWATGAIHQTYSRLYFDTQNNPIPQDEKSTDIAIGPTLSNYLKEISYGIEITSHLSSQSVLAVNTFLTCAKQTMSDAAMADYLKECQDSEYNFCENERPRYQDTANSRVRLTASLCKTYPPQDDVQRQYCDLSRIDTSGESKVQQCLTDQKLWCANNANKISANLFSNK